MAQQSQQQRREAAEAGLKAAFDVQREVVSGVGKKMAAGKGAARFVVRRIPGAPGLVLDAAEVATAKDPLREFVGVLGGGAGGLAGGALGTATGPAAPITVPIGAVAGSMAGEEFAEAMYDRHAEGVKRALREGLGSADQWIKARNADLAGGAARLTGVDRMYRAMKR